MNKCPTLVNRTVIVWIWHIPHSFLAHTWNSNKLEKTERKMKWLSGEGGNWGRKIKSLWDDKGIAAVSVLFWNGGIISVMNELYFWVQIVHLLNSVQEWD